MLLLLLLLLLGMILGLVIHLVIRLWVNVVWAVLVEQVLVRLHAHPAPSTGRMVNCLRVLQHAMVATCRVSGVGVRQRRMDGIRRVLVDRQMLGGRTLALMRLLKGALRH